MGNIVPFRSRAELLALEDQELIEKLKGLMSKNDMTVTLIAIAEDGTQNIFFNKPQTFDNAIKVIGHLDYTKMCIYSMLGRAFE